MAFVSVLYAMVLPHLMAKVNVKWLWAGANLLFGVLLVSTQWIESQTAAVIVVAFFGVPLATCFVVPWNIVTLVSREVGGGGMLTAVFNTSQCYPEILVALFGGVVVSAAGSGAGVLALGGLVSIVAALLVFRTEIPAEMLPGDDAYEKIGD